jgi:hypothetical protein
MTNDLPFVDRSFFYLLSFFFAFNKTYLTISKEAAFKTLIVVLWEFIVAFQIKAVFFFGFLYNDLSLKTKKPLDQLLDNFERI